MSQIQRLGLYEEVTSRIITELEEGRLPWVRPWDSTRCPCMMPRNGVTGRVYSGINVLILWCEAVEREFASQLAADRLHADDTTVPLLAKLKTSVARIWDYVRDDRPFGGT
ncbi:MAG: DUF1738 domain-containing protein, partial [Novosphingobium sp.]|nr:DUF1738 domain-containing protein [Novosphingobium sp.]